MTQGIIKGSFINKPLSSFHYRKIVAIEELNSIDLAKYKFVALQTLTQDEAKQLPTYIEKCKKAKVKIYLVGTLKMFIPLKEKYNIEIIDSFGELEKQMKEMFVPKLDQTKINKILLYFRNKENGILEANEDKNEELEKANNELLNEIETLKSNNANTVEEINKKVEEEQIKNNELQKQIENEKEQFEKIKQEKEKLEETLKEKENDILKINEELETIKQEIQSNDMSEIVKGKETQIKDLQDKLDTNSKNYVSCYNQKINCINEIIKIKDLYLESIHSLKGQEEWLEKDKNELQEQIANYQKEIQNLNEKIETLEFSNEELKDSKELVNSLNAKLNEMKELVSQREEEIQDLKIDMEDAENRLAEYDSLNIEELEDKYKVEQDKNKQLLKQIATLKENNTNDSEELFSTKTINRKLERELNQLKLTLAQNVNSNSNCELDCNYMGRAKVISVCGSGSYGITNTTISIAKNLKGSVLIMDLDCLSPKVDSWLHSNPIHTNLPDIARITNKTSFGALIEKGLDYVMEYEKEILAPISKNDKLKLDYFSGIYEECEPSKLMQINFTYFMNYIGNKYDYIVVDLGKLNATQIGTMLYKMFSKIAYKNVIVTLNDAIDVRSMLLKLSRLKINDTNMLWLLNFATSNVLDTNITKNIRTNKIFALSKSLKIYGEQMDFMQVSILKDQFETLLKEI